MTDKKDTEDEYQVVDPSTFRIIRGLTKEEFDKHPFKDIKVEGYESGGKVS